MQEIAQIMATIGFPSAVCIVLLNYVKNLNDTHREESKSYQKSIDANTAAINELIVWIKNVSDKNGEN